MRRHRLRRITVLAAFFLLPFVAVQASAVADPGVPQPSAGAPPTPPAPGSVGKAPAPAPGPSPAPVTGSPGGGGDAGKPAPPPGGGLIQPATPSDPNATGFFDIPGEVKDAITSFLAALLQPFVTPVMALLAHLLLSTPDVTQMPTVAGLWDGLRVLACSLYVLAVLAAGILAMSHGTVQHRWAARDLIPRLALGMLAANLSLTMCHQVIGLVNAISSDVFVDGITADDLAATLTGMLLNGNPTTGPVYLVVLALAVTVIAVAVVITVLIRVACVLVLVVAAPLLLACHGSPATEGAARLWWKAFFGIMGVQVLQSVVFLVTVKVLLDPGNYALLGVPTAGPLINLAVLGGCLYLLVKIPGWIRRLVTSPVQRTVGGGRGGLHLLQKVALGALGLPFGPYALGAQIAGRFRPPGAQGPFGMLRRGPRRPPGTPGTPGTPGGANPRGPRPPGAPGGASPPRPPGSGGAGTPPGGPRPGKPAGGPVPPGSGPGVPTYQWGTPRRNGPPRPNGTAGAIPRRQPAAPPAPVKPALPPVAGGQQSTRLPNPTPSPGPGGHGPRSTTPPPPVTPRPRPALPPPVPRPALPAPPLAGGPKPPPRQRRKP